MDVLGFVLIGTIAAMGGGTLRACEVFSLPRAPVRGNSRFETVTKSLQRVSVVSTLQEEWAFIGRCQFVMRIAMVAIVTTPVG